MPKDKQTVASSTVPGKKPLGRRGFLKGAAGAAAGSGALGTGALGTGAVLGEPGLASAQRHRGGDAHNTAPQPSEATLARDAGNVRPGPVTSVVERPNSDYMVDVIKA